MRERYPFFDTSLIARYAPDGAPILLALSGGADSSAALVCLAEYCAANGRQLHAAHLDHAIRADSAEDAAFCAELCARFGVRLHHRRVDVPALAEASGNGLEAEAREARYAYFADVMAEQKIPVLITAHHADDNLETMLMHLTRGSGLRGLCGIPPVRDFADGHLLRPFLHADKADLEAVCRANDIVWRVDETNTDVVYTRNRIRADILSVLGEINPAVASRAADTADALRADEEYLSAVAAARYAEFSAPDCADAGELLGQPPALRMRLYRLLHAVHAGGAMLEHTHCIALDRLLAMRVGALSLPGQVCARVDGGFVRFSLCPARPQGDSMNETVLLDATPGWTLVAQVGAQVGVFSADAWSKEENIAQNNANIYKLFINRELNFATIKGQLHWRLRRPGERIFLRGHHRSVKKLLSAVRVPLDVRNRLPVLCDEAGIVFLPGVGLRDDVAGGTDVAAVRWISKTGQEGKDCCYEC